MQTAVAAIRGAQESGIFQLLSERQHSAIELAERTRLVPTTIENLCRVLTAIGVLEQYGDDYALSQATSLQMQGDPHFNAYLQNDVESYLANQQAADGFDEFRHRLAARQWSCSAAARQAASVIETSKLDRPLQLLELGCLAGVWSAALAFNDKTLEVTSVDIEPMHARARHTFQAIELMTQRREVVADFRHYEPELAASDFVLLAEGLQLQDDPNAVILLGRCADALRQGGEIIIVEHVLDSGEGQDLSIASQALEVGMASKGKLRTVNEIQQLLTGAGFQSARWAPLNADDQGLAIIVAQRNDSLN